MLANRVSQNESATEEGLAPAKQEWNDTIAKQAPMMHDRESYCSATCILHNATGIIIISVQ